MTDPIAELMAEVDAEIGEPEVTPAEQPRDESGRFAAQAEEVAETEEAPAEEPELIAGRFKSTDDLAKSYLSLEEKFKERDSELGELRQLREQLEQQQTQTPAVPLNQDTVDWFDEQIEQNPYGAAVWALQSDPSGVLYDRAMESWYDVQPRQAAAFERHREMAEMAQAFDQRVSSVAAPVEQQAQQNAFVAAWANVAQRHSDLPEHAEAILEAAQQAPEIVSLLKTATPEAQERVIENLLFLSKGKQATSLGQAAQDMAVQQAQETQAAKAQSFVASSGQRQEPDTTSAVDRWFEEVLDPALAQYS